MTCPGLGWAGNYYCTCENKWIKKKRWENFTIAERAAWHAKYPCKATPPAKRTEVIV